MNNWDKRPELVVVYGGQLPHHVLDDVATNHLQLSKDVVFPIQPDDELIVYDVEDMQVPHIHSVVTCLIDHIDNTKPEQWLTHLHDYQVDEEGDLFVSVSKGTYYGQNCKVTVYNITI